MRKQVLDIEQMRHLKDLGVDTSKASMVLLYTDDEGEIIEWEDADEFPEKFIGLYDAEAGNYDHSCRKYCGVFTLQDILDLLPKEIKDKDDDKFVLRFEYGNLHKIWYIGYYYYDVAFNDKCWLSEKELIDAAYELLCWCIENGYVKTNK